MTEHRAFHKSSIWTHNHKGGDSVRLCTQTKIKSAHVSLVSVGSSANYVASFLSSQWQNLSDTLLSTYDHADIARNVETQTEECIEAHH